MEAEAQWWGRRHRCDSGPGPGALILYLGLQVTEFLLLLGTKLLLGGRSFLVCNSASAILNLLHCVGCGVM